MFLIDLVIAIAVSFLAVAIVLLTGHRGPWHNPGILFLIVLLISWAGGIWLTPIGPALYGSYWIPYIIMAGLAALLLVNILPHKDKKIIRSPEERLEEEEPEDVVALFSLGVSFWIFICVLILAIGLAYIL